MDLINALNSLNIQVEDMNHLQEILRLFQNISKINDIANELNFTKIKNEEKEEKLPIKNLKENQQFSKQHNSRSTSIQEVKSENTNTNQDSNVQISTNFNNFDFNKFKEIPNFNFKEEKSQSQSNSNLNSKENENLNEINNNNNNNNNNIQGKNFLTFLTFLTFSTLFNNF